MVRQQSVTKDDITVSKAIGILPHNELMERLKKEERE